MSFKASSQEQFYVSVSRGKQAVAIYTDDKEELLQAIAKSNERRSAIELVKNNNGVIQKAMDIKRVGLMARIREKALKTAQQMKNRFNKQQDIMNDYELHRKTKPTDFGKER
jgi:siroheme synthase (precorrin-2 oxidase/ferrochelatase)